jgi:hypothetical protein
VYWSGTIRSELLRRDLSFALTCIGQPGNAASAACATAVIRDLSPALGVLIGIAGGMPRKVKIGDVVFAETVVAYEPGALTTLQSGWLSRLVRRVFQVSSVASVGAETRVEPRPAMYAPPQSIWQDVVAYRPDPDRLASIFVRMGAGLEKHRTRGKRRKRP